MFLQFSFFLFTLYINFNVLFWSKLLCYLLYCYNIASYDTFLNFLKHFKTLLRVRVILVTLCDIYILVVMYRHSLFLFDSVPGNKALECISDSYTTENVISLSLKCSSVWFPFFKQYIYFIYLFFQIWKCAL